jgi:hypothetical protein
MGVILIAQPPFIFRTRSSSRVSLAGVALSCFQVRAACGDGCVWVRSIYLVQVPEVGSDVQITMKLMGTMWSLPALASSDRIGYCEPYMAGTIGPSDLAAWQPHIESHSGDVACSSTVPYLSNCLLSYLSEVAALFNR